MSGGRVVVVTGGTGALGKATAHALAARGATVVLACRDRVRGEAALEEVRRGARGEEPTLVTGDLSEPASLRRLAEEVRRQHPALNGLIHTAAIFTRTRRVTPAGHELMFATNHLGPFLLTRELEGALRAGAPSRVWTVTAPSTTRIDFADLSGEKRFRPLFAFGATKAANLLFAFELARRLEGSGVTSNAFHPGIVRSDLVREMPAVVRAITRLSARPPDRAAAALADLTLGDAYTGVTGRFYKHLKLIEAPAGSRDPAVQRRLWEESERLLAVGPPV